LQLHSDCIATAAGGGWDVITSVPSTAPREGEHPLAAAINLVPDLRGQYEELLHRGSGQIDHTVASDGGYEPAHEVSGHRILLVDDTFTSGARAQSAASALNNAGATVAAIVPIGRVINPDFNEENEAYWRRQSKLPYAFDTCCVGPH
jgi:hypothetical protein